MEKNGSSSVLVVKEDKSLIDSGSLTLVLDLASTVEPVGQDVHTLLHCLKEIQQVYYTIVIYQVMFCNGTIAVMHSVNLIYTINEDIFNRETDKQTG